VGFYLLIYIKNAENSSWSLSTTQTEFKVIPLAIALIMGIASTAFVKSFVDNIVMPIVTPFIPGGAWETATLAIGPIVLRWGAFLGESINFIVIAFVVFLVAKMVLKEEKVGKR
jgi:large conductance mechanosensitive channel